MKLQNLTVIFIIIILPIILLVSFYISTGLKTINYQAQYDTALLTATHDAIYAFEINTARDKFSDNPEAKRDILKSSIKMFEKSLCNGCNISAYDTREVEKYIPALVFGMYDGFYMYAPSYVASTDKYEHNLKNYVYYSERFEDGTVITYTLDNYVTVFLSGNITEIREGYLINPDDLQTDEDKNITGYKGVGIANILNKDLAGIYYKEAQEFTDWFLNEAKVPEKEIKINGETKKADYLDIKNGNDPEDPNSLFVQHKKDVMKEKIESVLNSSITVYSKKTLGYDYKMPKLSEEDWEKVYDNISVISFFQGKDIGFTTYNGYCVLNSTNSNEYVNPNLMYFIYDDTDENTQNYYHDIRCSELNEINDYTRGYKIGAFQKQYVDDGTEEGIYTYRFDELACYECINGQLKGNCIKDGKIQSVYEYINSDDIKDNIKSSYWTSLAMERYNITKVTNVAELRGITECNIEINWKDYFEGNDYYGAEQNFNGFRPDNLSLVIKKDENEFINIEIKKDDESGNFIAKVFKKGRGIDNISLDNADTWQIHIDGLEAYEGDKEVTYKVYRDDITSSQENQLREYGIDVYEKKEKALYVIDCTNNPAFIDKEITVKWLNDTESERPESIKVLMETADLEDSNREKILYKVNNSSDNWKYTFEGLREYKNGEKVDWKAKQEEFSSDYKSKYKTEYPDTYTITNTLQLVEKTVTIEWDDNNNAGENRPGSVKVEFKASGMDDYVELIINSNNTNTWIGKVKVQQYKDGREINWQASIVVPEGYESEKDVYKFTLRFICNHDRSCKNVDGKYHECLVCRELVEHYWYSTGSDYESHSCFMCDATEEHEWGTDSTCDKCGYECDEHNWDDGICKICNASCEHNNIETAIVEQATCYATGTEELRCKDCGYILYSNDIPKTEHVFTRYEPMNGEYHRILCVFCSAEAPEGRCSDGNGDGYCEYCGWRIYGR